jgi:quercetin dioxygenase-like cupin family protein
MSHKCGCGEKGFRTGEIFNLKGLVEYGEGAVVSRTIQDKGIGTVTVFAFDEGQGLSEHSAPFDALVQVLDGKVEITLGGEPHELKAGEAIIMPANIPHALRAITKFKMLLTMIKKL